MRASCPALIKTSWRKPGGLNGMLRGPLFTAWLHIDRIGLHLVVSLVQFTVVCIHILFVFQLMLYHNCTCMLTQYVCKWLTHIPLIPIYKGRCAISYQLRAHMYRFCHLCAYTYIYIQDRCMHAECWHCSCMRDLSHTNKYAPARTHTLCAFESIVRIDQSSFE